MRLFTNHGTIKTVLLFSFVFFFTICSELYAEDQDFNINKALYGERFSKVSYFGHLHVYFEGDVAENIDLNQGDLEKFVKLRYKNNFSNIPYTNKSDQIIDLYDKQEGREIGSMIVRVWVVGDDYPVAYHIRLFMGTFDNMRDYSDELLGYGSAKTAPDSIKNAISDLMERSAITFFESRGEL